MNLIKFVCFFNNLNSFKNLISLKNLISFWILKLNKYICICKYILSKKFNYFNLYFDYSK